MKLLCNCGIEVFMSIVGKQYQHTYEGTCPKCKTMWQLIDVIAKRDTELDNIPAECEDADCTICNLTDYEKRHIDCPRVD